MVAPPMFALLYPTLLASLVAHPNRTLVIDDNGIPHVVDIKEPVFTQAEIAWLKESALQTSFHLYTRNNPTVGQELFIDDLASVNNSFWNPKHPTRLVTHGWQGNGEGDSCTLIRDAYLRSGDYNVIVIDWRTAAGDIWYPRVTIRVTFVAERVALLLDFLESKASLQPKSTLVVGHSLGGHVAGLGARFATNKIGQVVALDPAKALFDTKSPGERVDRSDAIIVQGIHTNAGRFGLEQAIGTADFYPNGGKQQAGCEDMIGICAHARSYLYYAESITNPKGFRAGSVFMGGPSLDENANGNYTLKTASKSPFALG